MSSQYAIRLAVVDDDSGFVTVLAKRAEAAASASTWHWRSAMTADRREWAMTMLLAARAIERIGDNAVDS